MTRALLLIVTVLLADALLYLVSEPLDSSRVTSCGWGLER